MQQTRPGRRRLLGLLGVPLVLAGCGFAPRKAPAFAFGSIFLAAPAGSPLTAELQRQLQANGVRVITDPTLRGNAGVVLTSAGEQRQQSVVSMTSAGQVREYQRRLVFSFRVNTPQGRELLPDTQIMRQVDQSYSESLALSKEMETELLYRSMERDIAQQVVRRLSKIKL